MNKLKKQPFKSEHLSKLVPQKSIIKITLSKKKIIPTKKALSHLLVLIYSLSDSSSYFLFYSLSDLSEQISDSLFMYLCFFFNNVFTF